MKFNTIEKKYVDFLLPQGAIPTSIVTVLTYIDKMGENSWLMRVESDAPVTAVIGALELAKSDIMAATPGSSTISELIAEWTSQSEDKWYEIDLEDDEDDY